MASSSPSATDDDKSSTWRLSLHMATRFVQREATERGPSPELLKYGTPGGVRTRHDRVWSQRHRDLALGGFVFALASHSTLPNRASDRPLWRPPPPNADANVFRDVPLSSFALLLDHTKTVRKRRAEQLGAVLRDIFILSSAVGMCCAKWR